jgi:serine/threonine-protein kinase
MTAELTCLNCGEAVRSADRFCSQCGDELTLSSHPTTLLPGEANPEDDPESPWAEVVLRLRRATAGEFEIGRELGRGGMAAVFLAHEVSLDRKVAIKVMSPGLLMGAGMIDRFKREAITIAHLNHPNIVSCYSVRQAAGLHFFVMRYIRGRSLEQLIQDASPLPLPIVRSILCQVGSALTYAHRSQVVHRDIKPANILIDEDGNAVVTDFGIAKVAALPGQTHSGALVGTPAYMSPEQCSGAEVSGASDQYALGAVAYEMVTGAAPFTGSTLTVMNAQVEETPPPIRARFPECPAEVEAAILRMLSKDPAERFPSMAEAKAALGATPLMEDDPLLEELCRLVAAGVSSRTPDPERPALSVEPSPALASSASRTGAAGRARSLVILPPPAELAVGDSFALVALVRGERDVPLPGRTVEWSTDVPDVLHVDQVRKLAVAVTPGSALLTARCDGIQTQVPVQVPPNTIARFDEQSDEPAAAVQISMPPRSVRAGDSFVLTATPFDRAGHPLSEPSVLWSTSDVRVAVVTAEGWVAALGRGQVVLTATRGLASGSVTINVEQAIPTHRAAKPPARRHLPVEPVPDHRSTWRRRGGRTRRALTRTLIGLAGVLAAVWMFGGLRDFRWGAARRLASVGDTAQLAADTTRAEQPVDSIAPINRGAVDSAVTRPRPRRRAVTDTTVSAAPVPERPAGADTTTAGPDTPAVTGDPVDDASESLASRTTETGAVGDLTPSDTSGYAPLASTSENERPLEAAPSRSPSVAAPRNPPPPVDVRQVESALRDGVEECYDAVRSKNLERLAGMYHPRTYADEDKLRRLTRILRTEPWKATVGRRVDGPKEMGAAAAAAHFSFRLVWRDALGGRLSSQPIFRAEFARGTDGWTMSSCRIVGSPKL